MKKIYLVFLILIFSCGSGPNQEEEYTYFKEVCTIFYTSLEDNMNRLNDVNKKIKLLKTDNIDNSIVDECVSIINSCISESNNAIIELQNIEFISNHNDDIKKHAEGDLEQQIEAFKAFVNVLDIMKDGIKETEIKELVKYQDFFQNGLKKFNGFSSYAKSYAKQLELSPEQQTALKAITYDIK